MTEPAGTGRALPPLELETIHTFGPTRAYATGARTDTGVEPDKRVKTHCCF